VLPGTYVRAGGITPGDRRHVARMGGSLPWGEEPGAHVTTTSQHRSTATTTVSAALGDLDRRLKHHDAQEVRLHPTGFSVLDEVLGGGLHAGELLMLGGPPGVGKTICALQWARHLARTGRRVVFACYEHEASTLLVRLLSLELGELSHDPSFGSRLERMVATEERGLEEVLASFPRGEEALAAVRSYADDLLLVRASGAHTTVEDLAAIVADHSSGAGQPTVLFIDYLQKIPLHPEPRTEAEKVTRTVEAVKDLALDQHLPVVLLSAVDAEGMRASRLRLYHLRGSSAIAFESDVVLMLNDKVKAVSKVHLAYDAVRARGFRDWVVFSIEKNRGGPNLIDLEFRKDFAHFRYDPEGGMVAEKLVSERIDEDEV
jgi:replicative DNA helicase